MKPTILFLVPADYDALVRKGVARMIQERDEYGFFGRVITMHPLAFARRTFDLDAVHRIYELSLGRDLASAASHLGARLLLPFKVAAAFRAVARIARLEKVDLVRANDPYLMGLLGWWGARSVRAPFCVSVHADYEKRFTLAGSSGAGPWLRGIAARARAFVLPRADMILPIREHMVASIEASGADPNAIRVIPHGIDLALFEQPSSVDVRALFGIPENLRIVSFAGRFTADNYMSDIATTVERLSRRRHDVVFVLAGDGPEAGALRRRLVDDVGVSPAVRLVPFQDQATIVALRQASTVALCLMGGFSLIEACAAGCPVVAYDVEWHRELVRDAESGRLIREGDIDGLVAAVDGLLDDPVAASRMGRAARRLARERHDIAKNSQIKQACYAELLAARSIR